MTDFADLFIISPQKCGTTAMYWSLMQHPDINTSTEKELNFFRDLQALMPRFSSDLEDNIENFTNHFSHCDFAIRGLNKLYMKYWDSNQGKKIDISPLYFYDPLTLLTILNMCPTDHIIKIVFMTRNPLDRLISQYVHERATAHIATNSNVESKFIKDIDWVDLWMEQRTQILSDPKRHLVMNKHSFDSNVFGRYLEPGLYADKYELLLQNKKDNHEILFLEYNELVDDSDRFYQKILSFFEVDDTIKLENIKTNQGSFWKKYYDASQELKETEDLIKDYYYEHNEKFYDLTGVNYNV